MTWAVSAGDGGARVSRCDEGLRAGVEDGAPRALELTNLAGLQQFNQLLLIHGGRSVTRLVQTDSTRKGKRKMRMEGKRNAGRQA